MKAVSLHQPWASAIAIGAKHFETRSWPIRYRGPIAICAAKTPLHARSEERSRPALWANVFRTMSVAPGWLTGSLPFGAVVAVAEVVECYRVADLGFSKLSALELALGDFSGIRYGWLLENIVALPQPVPCRGFQSIFELPGDVAAAVQQQVAAASGKESGQ